MFDSDLIDRYMNMVARVGGNGIVNVPCCWLSQRLFKNNNPAIPKKHFYHTATKKALVQYKYVLLPCNIRGKHWSLFVLDIENKTIIACDSMGIDYENVWKQIIRYIGFDTYIHTQKSAALNEWKLSYFHNQKNFKRQEDNISCGPYVCLMAKAIVTGDKFEFDKEKCRDTIALENY